MSSITGDNVLLKLGGYLASLAGLLRYIISTPEVNFGDSRLFFADLRNELDHPYYPEVCVGYQGQQPELLSVSDTANDYSLMERPTRGESDRTTNENPAEAADRLLGIIRRYVELLPHEKTNLSVVLYYSLIQGEDCSPDQHFLPARQISFQEETTKTTFDTPKFLCRGRMRAMWKGSNRRFLK